MVDRLMPFDGVTRHDDAERIRHLEAARAVYAWRRMGELQADGVETAEAWPAGAWLAAFEVDLGALFPAAQADSQGALP